MKCCKCFKNENENRPWCDWRNVQIYFCVCYNTTERQTDEPRTDNSQTVHTVQPIQQTSQTDQQNSKMSDTNVRNEHYRVKISNRRFSVIPFFQHTVDPTEQGDAFFEKNIVLLE